MIIRDHPDGCDIHLDKMEFLEDGNLLIHNCGYAPRHIVALFKRADDQPLALSRCSYVKHVCEEHLKHWAGLYMKSRKYYIKSFCLVQAKRSGLNYAKLFQTAN